jgi:hypothetical protein
MSDPTDEHVAQVLRLTLAQDGTYARALASAEEMEQLLRHLGDEQANATNMDW